MVSRTQPGTTSPPSRPRRTRRRLVLAVAFALAASLAVWALTVQRGRPVQTDTMIGGIAVSQISTADLEKAARSRVFFGHQSVGVNILDGVPGVFTASGVTAVPIQHRRTPDSTGGGFIAESPIGENTKPLRKIEDFDAVIRSGLWRQLDVAVLKFCYIDVVPGTDVGALFTRYRDTIAALERDFPNVVFVKTTVPLTTQPSMVSRLKQGVRGNDAYGAAANAARERLNELIRKEYTGRHLFDLAAVESTAPDGSRISGRSDGSPHFALYDGYAADPGHLNGEGARRAATAFLAAVAEASSK